MDDSYVLLWILSQLIKLLCTDFVYYNQFVLLKPVQEIRKRVLLMLCILKPVSRIGFQIACWYLNNRISCTQTGSIGSIPTPSSENLGFDSRLV